MPTILINYQATFGNHMSGKKRTLLALSGLSATTVLVQPACAAVCPRGIGGCPSPGRCFLFTDIDGNTLCDYTRTAISGTPSVPAAVPGATPAIPSGGLLPVTQVVPGTIPSGLFDAWHPGAGVMGLILVIALSMVLVWLFRHRLTDVAVVIPVVVLGISEITVFLLLNGTVPGVPFALVYALAGIPFTAYLWKTGNLARTNAVVLLVLSTAAGFIFLSPIMPMEFTGLLGLALGHGYLAPGLAGIMLVLATGLVVGRIFCGHFCPVGTIQELASLLPTKKIDLGATVLPEIMRFVVCIMVIAGGVYFIELMAFTGVYDFFSITLASGFVIFSTILILAVFLYRPVCRFLCPYGVLFSVLSEFSRYRLRRSVACIECRKCEKACPVHVAGAGSSKRECYLCGRCIEVCPVKGAIVYGK